MQAPREKSFPNSLLAPRRGADPIHPAHGATPPPAPKLALAAWAIPSLASRGKFHHAYNRATEAGERREQSQGGSSCRKWVKNALSTSRLPLPLLPDQRTFWVSAGGANASVFRHATAQSLRVGPKILAREFAFLSDQIAKFPDFGVVIDQSVGGYNPATPSICKN